MHFQISNDRLVIDGRPAPFVASPNAGARIEPTLIVVHDTADRLKPNDSVAWFADPKSKVSAHFVVGRDGGITQMVACDRAAWHAGKSAWRGRANCNGFSVGIEIDNPGPLRRSGDCGVAWFGEKFPVGACGLQEIETKAHGRALWMPYTSEQIETVERLIRALAIAYPTITDVAAHFEISPGRKVDVGPQFPLGQLKAILGDRTPADAAKVMAAQRRLAALAYWTGDVDGVLGPRTRAALRAFEEQNGLPMTGALGPTTMQALTSSSAKAMPTAAREAMTKTDVAASGSQTLSAAAAVKRGTEVAGMTELVGALDSLERFRGAADRTGALVDWVLTPDGLRFAATVALLAVIWSGAHKIEWVRVRDHIFGRNVGGGHT